MSDKYTSVGDLSSKPLYMGIIVVVVWLRLKLDYVGATEGHGDKFRVGVGVNRVAEAASFATKDGMGPSCVFCLL